MSRTTSKISFLCLLCWLLLGLPACSGDDPAPEPALSNYDPSYLDTSVEPCADFYQFACGTWVAQHTPEPGSMASRFLGPEQRNSVYFMSIVEAMSSRDPNLRDAQAYYGSCLRAHQSSSTPNVPLHDALSDIAALRSLDDLPGLLAALHDGGVSALFDAGPGIDFDDPTHYTLFIAEAGWSLPARSSYDDAELAAAYRAHMTQLASVVQLSYPVYLDPQAVFDVEHAVALSGSDDRDPRARHNPLAADALVAALPSFDWSQYFAARGLATTRINLLEPKVLPGLTAILADTPIATLKQYLSWRTLEAYARAVDESTIAEEFAFHRGVVDGAQQAPSAEFDCYSNVRSLFGFVLAQHFVTEFVSSTLKPNVSSLVGQVQSAMRDNQARASWLDEPTRVQAREKLDLLLAKVGYPEPWPVDKLSIDASKTYLAQRVALAREAAEERAAALSKPVDRTEFWAPPDITNAFYDPQRNDITIPIGVLSDPFYREDRPLEFNFGVLGSVVGHELTHAFDSSGRRFDGQGALVDWWSEDTAAEFEHRAQCLVDQFDRYEALPGLNVDGKRTLDENIADLGGLSLSFAAFRAQPKRSAKSGPFSAEQQFFLAYAQAWCEASSDGVLARQIATDQHAPGRFRVNGSMRNLPGFAEAFACSAGSELAPTDRCQVW